VAIFRANRRRSALGPCSETASGGANTVSFVGPGRGRGREAGIALLTFVALGSILLAGTYRNFDYRGGKDWESFVGQTQAEVTTLREYGQLPMWNPWRGGGQPSLAQPVSMLFSPVTPLALFVGVLPAYKLMLVPLFVAGCFGMWLLAGHLGLSASARLVPPLGFFGSSVFPLYVSGGLPNWACAMAILPWLLLFHRRAACDGRFVVAAALGWAGVLFCGAVDRFLFLPVLLGLDALLVSASRRSLRPLFALAGILALGAGLAAVRVLPLLEVYIIYPREMADATRHLSPALLPRVFLGAQIPDLVNLDGAFVGRGADQVYWINVGSYIGPVAALLVGLGAALEARATWVLTAMALVLAWLSFGSGVEPSLWQLLHRLPPLSSLQGPERLVLFLTFYLSLLAGFGHRAFQGAIASRWPESRCVRWGSTSLVLAAMMVPMLAVNAPLSATAFVVEPRADARAAEPPSARPPFRQALERRHALQWGPPLLDPVLRNEGNVLGYTNIPIPRAARPHRSRAYRGEAYLEGGRGVVSDLEITPNEIRLRAEVAEADHLVVNQNFFPGWRAQGAEAEPRSLDGLLALPLPSGRHDVVLRFRPGPAMAGAIVTLASAIGCGVILARGRPARRALREQPSDPRGPGSPSVNALGAA